MKRFIISWVLASIFSLYGATLIAAQGGGLSAETPLMQSGLNPVWEENFSQGGLDRMQYSWAKGQNWAINSYVQQGLVYIGHENATAWPWAEQQINNFKQAPTDPLPQTIEFDLFSPITGYERVSLRPHRMLDFAHFKLGRPQDETEIRFKLSDGSDSVTIEVNQSSGPDYGWAHIVASYRQYYIGSQPYIHYVVAINEEVYEYNKPYDIPFPLVWADYYQNDPHAIAWSIELNTTSTPTIGKYLANIRGYNEFLSQAEMSARLDNQVDSYLATIPNPLENKTTHRYFQGEKTLIAKDVNAMAYAVPNGILTADFDGSLSSSWEKITSYQWNFSDGTTATGRFVPHQFDQPGIYTGTLTIANEYGSETHQVTVPVSDLHLSPTHVITVAPSDSAIITHTLTNLSPISHTFQLLATDNLHWPLTIAPASPITLQAYQSMPLTLTTTVPLTATTIQTNQIKLQALAIDAPYLITTVVNTLPLEPEPEPEPIYAFSLSSDQAITITAGHIVTLTQHLTNTGTITDSYTMLASSPIGWDQKLSPTLVASLAPTATTSFTLTLTPPLTATTVLTEFVVLNISSTAIPTLSQSLTHTITLTPEPEPEPIYAFTLSSAQAITITAGHTVTLTQHLTNTGTITDSYTVLASSPIGWDQKLSPTLVASLAPTATTSFTLTLTPPLTATTVLTEFIVLNISSTAIPTLSQSLTHTITLTPQPQPQPHVYPTYLPILWSTDK